MLAQPYPSGPSSPDSSLNHWFDNGKWRRTIGPTKKSITTPTNGNMAGVAVSRRAIMKPIRQYSITSVFGKRNHTRRPRRNESNMPKDSASEKTPTSTTPRRPDARSPPSRHTPTSVHRVTRTDNATYIQAIASTILTGNGFFISQTVYQKFIRRGAGARRWRQAARASRGSSRRCAS